MFINTIVYYIIIYRGNYQNRNRNVDFTGEKFGFNFKQIFSNFISQL